MLRLSTFCILLAVAVAQNGYDYNRPGKPFGAGTTPSRPGKETLSGYPSSPTPVPYPSGPQGDGYPNQAGSTPGFTAPAGYPSGPNQGNTGTNTISSNQGYQKVNAGSGSNQGFNSPGITSSTSQGFSSPNNQQQQTQQTGYPVQDSSFLGQSTGASTGGFSSQQGSGEYSNGQNYPGTGTGSSRTSSPSFGTAGTGSALENSGAYEGGDYSAIPGEPDRDYPILTEIPETSFRCDAQPYPGYYADVETRCQVFHVCANNRTYNFLCPNGTIFSQQVFVCVWWNQFDCNSAPGLYELNANLYDYSIMGSQGGQTSEYSQGTSGTYQGGNVAQSPSSNYPGVTGPLGPNTGYPGNSESGSATNYQSGYGSQKPSSMYSNSGLSEGNSIGYQVGPESQRQLTGYPGGSSTQGSTGYSGNLGASSSFPGSTPQGPSASYPGSSGSSSTFPVPQGEINTYSGSQGQKYSGSPTPSPTVGNQGYPSGRPSGPRFPTGSNSVGQKSQTDISIPAQPNREYLPPRN